MRNRSSRAALQLYCLQILRGKHLSSVSDSINDYHIPVMLQECMDTLRPAAGKLYVDGTLGGGGHTLALLERGACVIGVDQDDDAIAAATTRLHSYVKTNQLEIMKGNFRNLDKLVLSNKLFNGMPVDGILLDLGMSSHQINEGTRGFSFQNNGPLDMRMDSNGYALLTALDIVNTWESKALADLFYQLGDEKNSRVIAREIVASRPLQTTQELNAVICRVTPSSMTQKTLARCFQAIRIFINDEMGALDAVLMAAANSLRDGGIMCVLSYHSLEDRRVKLAFRNKYPETFEFSPNTSSSIPFDEYIRMHQRTSWEPIKKKAILPSISEINQNSRSRSAKMRAAKLKRL